MPHRRHMQLGIGAPRIEAKGGKPFESHGSEGETDLDTHTQPAGLLGGDHLRPASKTRLKAYLSRPGVLAHGSSEEFDGFFGRVGIADGPARSLPIAFPHRGQRVTVISVVIGLMALFPAHQAGFVPPRPERIRVHGNRLHPDDLLVVDDAEPLPD